MAEKMQENESGRMAALEIISKINAVEGFNPTAVTSEVASEVNPGEKENFLPLIWKKAWARMVYPLHRCPAKITGIENGYVAAKAEFFVDNDPIKAPIGEGFVFKKIDTSLLDQEQAKNEAVSLALGSAKSRAYTDAGFGLQFYTEDCIDDIQAASIAQMKAGLVADGKPAKADTPAVPKEGETAPIPTVRGNSLAAKLQLSDEPENAEPEEKKGKSRANQYEMARALNDELVTLAGQIPLAVERIISAAIGSTEHDAAKKTLDSIREKWNQASQGIASRMEKPSVLKAKSEDTEYVFFDKTFDQVLAEAKVAYRSKHAAQAEEEPVSVSEPAVTQAVEETPAPAPVQQTVFMMSVEEARKVLCTTGKYAGSTVGELYDDSVKRNILPRLFERSEDMNERLALKTVIENDADLVAYCERNGKVLVV